MKAKSKAVPVSEIRWTDENRKGLTELLELLKLVARLNNSNHIIQHLQEIIPRAEALMDWNLRSRKLGFAAMLNQLSQDAARKTWADAPGGEGKD